MNIGGSIIAYIYLMKYLILYLFLLLCPCLSIARTIGVGYRSDKVTLWRFWEIGKRNIAEPKILVYNKTDKPISFFLRKKRLDNDSISASDRKTLLKVYGKDSDTMIRLVTIRPHEYSVYDMAADTSGRNYGFYDAVYIDGKYCGIKEDMGALHVGEFEHRYYSTEGLSGSSECIIGKDELFSKRGKRGRMSLYFDCSRKERAQHELRFSAGVKPGIQYLSMCTKNGNCHEINKPDDKILFSVNTDTISSFTIDVSYTLENSDNEPYFEFRTSFNRWSTVILMPVFRLY